MDPRIANYIRANRKKFPRQAITDRLVAAGHDRAEVERSWSALDARAPDAVLRRKFTGKWALIVSGLTLAALILAGLVSGTLQAAARGLGGGMGDDADGSPAPSPAPRSITVRLGAPVRLTEGMSATCQPNGTDPRSWTVFGHLVLEDGSAIDVAVSALPTKTGVLETSVYVSLVSSTDPEPEHGLAWAGVAPEAAQVDLSADPDVLAGRVTFVALPALQQPDGSFGPSLSGEMTWRCA